MDQGEAVEYTETDPARHTVEKEFHVGFTKADELARVDTSIRSMMDRLLTHSDFVPGNVSVLQGESYTQMPLEDFQGEGAIVFLQGKIPIESLKINANPRSARSYAQIISSQEKVTSFNDE